MYHTLDFHHCWIFSRIKYSYHCWMDTISDPRKTVVKLKIECVASQNTPWSVEYFVTYCRVFTTVRHSQVRVTLTDVSTTWMEVIFRVKWIHLYHLLTFHNSLDFDDDFRSGCRNVSQSHHKQSFSGLHSPGWSKFTYLWHDSWVQTIYKKTYETQWAKMVSNLPSVSRILTRHMAASITVWSWTTTNNRKKASLTIIP